MPSADGTPNPFDIETKERPAKPMIPHVADDSDEFCKTCGYHLSRCSHYRFCVHCAAGSR